MISSPDCRHKIAGACHALSQHTSHPTGHDSRSDPWTGRATGRRALVLPRNRHSTDVDTAARCSPTPGEWSQIGVGQSRPDLEGGRTEGTSPRAGPTHITAVVLEVSMTQPSSIALYPASWTPPACALGRQYITSAAPSVGRSGHSAESLSMTPRRRLQSLTRGTNIPLTT